MAFELRQIRQVLALAEHGSFVRAAAALRLSQPALSRSIRTIEQRIGTDLFQRSASGVVPTDICRLFVQRARLVVKAAEDFDDEIVANQSLQSGQVLIGGGPFPVETFVSTALASFIGEYPNIAVRVQVRRWDELLRRLRARELDFFIAEVSTMQKDHDLEIQLMSRHPLYFVARAGHPLAGRVRSTPAHTFAYPFVALSGIPPRLLAPMLAAQRGAAESTATMRAFPSVECHALAAVKRIVGGSNAITAATLSCIDAEIESGQLVLLGSEPWMNVHYGLVRLKDAPLNQAASRFREFVVAAERDASIQEEQASAKWMSRSYSRKRSGRSVTRGSGRRASAT